MQALFDMQRHHHPLTLASGSGQNENVKEPIATSMTDLLPQGCTTDTHSYSIDIFSIPFHAKTSITLRNHFMLMKRATDTEREESSDLSFWSFGGIPRTQMGRIDTEHKTSVEECCKGGAGEEKGFQQNNLPAWIQWEFPTNPRYGTLHKKKRNFGLR